MHLINHEGPAKVLGLEFLEIDNSVKVDPKSDSMMPRRMQGYHNCIQWYEHLTRIPYRVSSQQNASVILSQMIYEYSQ